jgi:hypothetical protein
MASAKVKYNGLELALAGITVLIALTSVAVAFVPDMFLFVG